jgi:hypothetical protein
MRYTLVLLISAVLFGCPSNPVTPQAKTGADQCDAAQAHLLPLGCKDSRGQVLGAPNLHGVSFADVCRNEYANGIDFKAGCLATVKDCAGVPACAP